MRFIERQFTVAAAGAVHLFVLCAPVAAVAGLARLTTDLRLALFLMLVIGWATLEAAAQPAHRARPQVVHGPRWIGRATGALLLLAFWTSLVDRAVSAGDRFDMVAAAGTVAMLTGIGLRLLAIRALGCHFLDEVGLARAHPLVTQSIYGRIRHPAEAGTLCIAVGAAALLASACGLVIVLALLFLILWRIRLEDELLFGQHRQAFAGYAREVGALVPFTVRHRHCAAP